MASTVSHPMAHSPVSKEAAPGHHGPGNYGSTPPLEDSQMTMLDPSPARFASATIVKGPIPEVKRFSRPDTTLDIGDTPYTFGVAPVHSKNQFSGKAAVPIDHFGVQPSKPKPAPGPARQQQSQWRDPQSSPISEGNHVDGNAFNGNLSEGNTADMAHATDAANAVESGAQHQPPSHEERKPSAQPSPAQQTKARKDRGPPIQQVEHARNPKNSSVIGDLDDPGAAKAKRDWKDTRRPPKTVASHHVHQEPRESVEFLQPETREASARPRANEMHLASIQEYHQSNDKSGERHHYMDGGHVIDHFPMMKQTPSECSSVKPASYVSNVSKRRNLKHRSRHSIVPDTPMQKIQFNMQAIDSDRSRLRNERDHALQTCHNLHSQIQDAKDRIAVGKSQLQHSNAEHHALGLENQKLQAQIETLHSDLETRRKAAIQTETLLVDKLNNSEARLAKADNDFKKLKAKCSTIRDRLDKAIETQKALARKSKEHWFKALAECQNMRMQIQGDHRATVGQVEIAAKRVERSAAIIDQVKNFEHAQKIGRLEDKLQKAQEELRAAEEESRELRQELEHQRQFSESMESCKNEIITAMSALKDQFDSSHSSQDNDVVRQKLDSILSLLESSDRESQSGRQAMEGLEGRLKENLSAFADEIHQSTHSHETLMQEISRIEQTLCCEMKTLRETHSTREAEMRRELASLAEEKAKSTASLEAERLRLQRVEAINEQGGTQVAALQEMVEEAKTQLLSTTQRAEVDLDLLRQEVAAKQQQLDALLEDSTRANEKNQQDVANLTAEIQELKKSAIVNQQRELSDIDVKKLQESESRALQDLQAAQSEIIRLKEESKTEMGELQKQLKISEQRHANLAHRMKAKGISLSPPGSNEAGELNATQLEKNMQQLAGAEKYLEKLASEATDVKEMETMIRTLVEIQGVLLSTHERSMRETLEMELVAVPDQQASRARRFNSAPDSSHTAAQAANFVGKQIIIRTPSQDGEEPGVAALAPGRERMQRRIRGPEKSILRQTTGHTAGGEPMADGAAQVPPLESFAPFPRAGRTYSRPVEGKPAQSTHAGHPAGRNNEAVQSIKTTLVGGQLNGSQGDALTSLAAWKGTQGTAALPSTKRAASSQDHEAANEGRHCPQAPVAAVASESTGGHLDRPRKRTRTYTGRTRSQDMVDLPPSNQQAQRV